MIVQQGVFSALWPYSVTNVGGWLAPFEKLLEEIADHDLYSSLHGLYFKFQTGFRICENSYKTIVSAFLCYFIITLTIHHESRVIGKIW